MVRCRVCLATGANKDIVQLQVDKNDNSKSYVDIFFFCLNIQVLQDSKISTKLCMKCFKKVKAFYEFKTLALKNDSYLKSLDIETGVKNEIFLNNEDVQVKMEPIDIPDDPDCTDNMKDELSIKTEDEPDTYESDNELLSVIKKIKYEYTEESFADNVPVKKGKKAKLKKYQSTKKKKYVSTEPKMCEECGKSVKDLKAHMEIHIPLEKRRKIKCQLCDKTFVSHHAKSKHNKIKHLGIKQKCPLCNKVVTHLKQHHRKMHDPQSLPHACVPCGRRFACRSSLEVHMTTHTKDRPHACDQCDKKFATKTLVMMHRRQVHDKEKTHLCQLCSKSFFKKYHLQVHLRSHSKEKPYECPDCGKWFSSSTIMKSHRLIHGGERKYACAHCDMTFVKLGYLRAHMISHTKEKRHPCQYCGIRFGRSDHRKRHEYTAHQKHLMSAKVPDTGCDVTKAVGARALLQRLEFDDTSQ